MKPILFSTPMVQAILDGRKTMTRRVVKISDCSERHKEFTFASWKNKKQELYLDNEGVCCSLCGWGVNNNGNKPIKPKYQVGDVLWVRETWTYGRVVGESDEYGNSEFWLEQTQKEEDEKCIFYKADMDDAIREDISFEDVFWKPSIFMPKEACRIFLRVTNVRFERLQDISVEDIKKEGAPLITITGNNEDFINSKLRGWWYYLWNSINGKGAWEANPFVFVYEFQRIGKPN